MPKVSDEHRQARREEILAAAQRAFAAKGYQRTSMADVLAESGLSTGAVYAYFTGKRELFVAMAREVLLRRNAEILTASAGEEPPAPGAALRIVLLGALREGVQPGMMMQLWSEAAIDAEMRDIVNRQLGVIMEIFTGVLERWFTAHPEQAPDGAQAAAARYLPVMLSLGQGFMLQYAILDGFDADAYFDTVAELLPH